VARAPAEAARSAAAQAEALLAWAVATIQVSLLPLPEGAVLQHLASWRAADGPPPRRSLLAQKQALLI
jgi:hypothetical protein